jgi:neutral amino acid transport system permease protein
VAAEPAAGVSRAIALPVFRTPAARGLLVLASTGALLIVVYGLHDVAQRTLNGAVAGSYFALGAVGLTLVYGILKLVNFAHGDFLTLGAYVAFLVNVTLGAPIVVAVVCAGAVVALLGVGLELTLLRSMRAKRAGMLQLVLVTIGLAFVMLNGIQLIAGAEPRNLHVDNTTSVTLLGLRIGRTELVVVIAGMVVLVAVGLALRYTRIGQIMRAVADNLELAETTGIATGRIAIATWVFAGALAGLAGVLYAAALGSMTPNLGFFLILSLFAAVILGGIGNAYGALLGGLILGLVQEWSTLVVDGRWKVAIGFLVLIGVLTLRPEGLFGHGRRV